MMTSPWRRLLFALVAALSLPAAYGVFGWIAEARPLAHPTRLSLNQLAAYPTKSSRQAVFASLATEDQSRLWRDQLQHRLSRQPELSEVQARFIRETIPLLIPQAFVKGTPENEALKAICHRGAGLFVAPEDRAVFSNLGSEGRRAFTVDSARMTVAIRLRATFHPTVSAFDDCECNADSWCNDGCHVRPCHQPETDSCGCFWIWSCDGIYAP